MADTWKNYGVRIEELEGRIREFERLISVTAAMATEMAVQLKRALVVTTAIPVEQTEKVEALQQRVTQYEVEAVVLRALVADLEKDRDKWRKMVEMEDAEIMGIIGVNDRG